MVVRKIQTSINLTPEIKHIVDTENLNLSSFVEEQLEKYFSVSSIEEVDRKISTFKQEILALERKRADLLEKGVAETREDAVSHEVWEELKTNYKIRQDSDKILKADFAWLCGPKNLERCRLLGKEPDKVLDDLEEWYDGLQKNHD
jgi:hypothetical protein